MNKQMKNGNSSLLHEDKDTKNKQMKRDSSSLEPEDSVTVDKQMETAAAWSQKTALQ